MHTRPKSVRSFLVLSTITLGFLGAGTASAETVAIPAVRDNTLIDNAEGGRSNGAGPFFFAGRVSGSVDPEDPLSTPIDPARRGLVAFDLSSYVPAGTRVVSAYLALYSSRSHPGPQTIALHRVVADWGEGASSHGGGSGAPSEPGDATWIHRFYDDGFWAHPGGDFLASSASTVVDGTGYYTWGPTEAMIADVQGWVDDPASDHGWLLRGNEAVPQTVKRFHSRDNEDAATHPMLVVDFVLPDDDGDGDDGGGHGGHGGHGDHGDDEDGGGHGDQGDDDDGGGQGGHGRGHHRHSLFQEAR